MLKETFLTWCQSWNLSLNTEQIDRLMILEEELLRWNQRINLTAITEPLEVLEKHLLDSLSCLSYFPKNAHVLDVGSGGGFPGLPLKIVRPDLRLVSVDSVGKKIRFQQHMVRTLALKDFSPLATRVENLPLKDHCVDGFDRVVSRAFSDLETFVRWVSPLCHPQGKILAMKGAEGRKEAEETAEKLDDLGWAVESIEELKLPRSESQRSLVLLSRK